MLYGLFMYLITDPEYGKGVRRRVLYIPHTTYNFNELLDCVKMCYHDTDIPQFIELVLEFLNDNTKEEERVLLHTQFQGKFSELFDNKYERLFNILKDGQADEDKSKCIRRLLNWCNSTSDRFHTISFPLVIILIFILVSCY